MNSIDTIGQLGVIKNERSAPSDFSCSYWLQLARKLRYQVRTVEKLPGSSVFFPIARHFLSEVICKLTYNRGDMPLAVGIETQAICNRRCKYCTIASPEFLTSRTVKILSVEMYRKILNDLAAFPRRRGKAGFCGTLHLNGFGEPLLDKNLESRVRMAREVLPEARIGFYSNGDYLTEELYLKLKFAGVREIIVTPHDGQHRQNLIELAQKYAGDGIIMLSTPLKEFSNRAGEIPIKTDQLQSPNRFCVHPTYTLEVASDGQITYCANDSLLKRPMGNVVDQSIMEIWDNPIYKQLRKNLRWGKINKLPDTCKACRTGVD